MSKVHNFSAGPCILPQEVLKQASEAVINFNDLNLSLIEISHRSKDFVDVMEKEVESFSPDLGVIRRIFNVFLLHDVDLELVPERCPTFDRKDPLDKTNVEKDERSPCEPGTIK